MQEDVPTLLTLPIDAVPPLLRDFLAQLQTPAVIGALELLADGQVVVQVLPEVDPTLVARVRRILSQYDDVLRRLS
jgi:hypothetical protein